MLSNSLCIKDCLVIYQNLQKKICLLNNNKTYYKGWRDGSEFKRTSWFCRRPVFIPSTHVETQSSVLPVPLGSVSSSDLRR